MGCAAKGIGQKIDLMLKENAKPAYEIVRIG